MCYTIALKFWDEFNANFVLLYFSSYRLIKIWQIYFKNKEVHQDTKTFSVLRKILAGYFKKFVKSPNPPPPPPSSDSIFGMSHPPPATLIWAGGGFQLCCICWYNGNISNSLIIYVFEFFFVNAVVFLTSIQFMLFV